MIHIVSKNHSSAPIIRKKAATPRDSGLQAKAKEKRKGEKQQPG
jgi:hypothetical protein